MADEAKTEVTTETATTEAKPNVFTQDQVNDFLAREQSKIESKYADYGDLKTAAEKLSKIEEANKTDLEKVTGERDSLKSAAESAAAEALRLRVALTKQLPAELIDRLRGSTKEELEADADELLQLVKPQGRTSFDGGKGRESGPAPTSMNDRLRKAAGR
jgi:predicted metal-dependent hydrolase